MPPIAAAARPVLPLLSFASPLVLEKGLELVLELNPNDDREDVGCEVALPPTVASALGIGSLRVEPIAPK